jgi:hypothetical protein
MNDLFGPCDDRYYGWSKSHPARPGSGPKGEKCKTCGNFFVRYLSKKYFKCWLMKHCWTGGKGTDVRANDEACSKWEVETKGVEQ